MSHTNHFNPQARLVDTVHRVLVPLTQPETTPRSACTTAAAAAAAAAAAVTAAWQLLQRSSVAL